MSFFLQSASTFQIEKRASLLHTQDFAVDAVAITSKKSSANYGHCRILKASSDTATQQSGSTVSPSDHIVPIKPTYRMGLQPVMRICFMWSRILFVSSRVRKSFLATTRRKYKMYLCVCIYIYIYIYTYIYRERERAPHYRSCFVQHAQALACACHECSPSSRQGTCTTPDSATRQVQSYKSHLFLEHTRILTKRSKSRST